MNQRKFKQEEHNIVQIWEHHTKIIKGPSLYLNEENEKIRFKKEFPQSRKYSVFTNSLMKMIEREKVDIQSF